MTIILILLVIVLIGPVFKIIRNVLFWISISGMVSEGERRREEFEKKKEIERKRIEERMVKVKLLSKAIEEGASDAERKQIVRDLSEIFEKNRREDKGESK